MPGADSGCGFRVMSDGAKKDSLAGWPVNPLASDEIFLYRARNIEKSMTIWQGRPPC
jgi:hypothetical protein